MPSTGLDGEIIVMATIEESKQLLPHATAYHAAENDDNVKGCRCCVFSNVSYGLAKWYWYLYAISPIFVTITSMVVTPVIILLWRNLS